MVTSQETQEESTNTDSNSDKHLINNCDNNKTETSDNNHMIIKACDYKCIINPNSDNGGIIKYINTDDRIDRINIIEDVEENAAFMEDEKAVAKKISTASSASVQSKSSLKVSKSVPLFTNTEEDRRDSLKHCGSETNLDNSLLDIPNQDISQCLSYKQSKNQPQPQNEARDHKPSVLRGQNNPKVVINGGDGKEAGSNLQALPKTLKHKVQFTDNLATRRKTTGSVENLGKCEDRNSVSPSKTFGGFIKSGSPGKRKNRKRQVSEASSISASSVTSISSGTSYSYEAPDGGYGWVVVAASFLVNMIADGVTFSFGVMFEEFETEFGSTKAETAGVVAVFHAVPLLTGPLATWLTDRYGCRKVTILGSILACIGFLLASFSHHIALLYLFFGAIAGFGLSLCYVAAIIVVAYYFDRRRSFATGISVCGSGVGTFVFAPFTQYLLDTYNGWRGACVILAGIFLNMCVCGMLFRELPWTKKLRDRRGSSRSLSIMPEIEELRLALEEGDISMLIMDSEEETPRLASSLIHLPTYIKNPDTLPPDVMTLLATNKRTYNYIVHNFPDSLIAKSISDYNLEKDEIDSTKLTVDTEDNKQKDWKDRNAGVKLARRVSWLIKKAPKSILKTDKEDKMENSPFSFSPERLLYDEDQPLCQQSNQPTNQRTIDYLKAQNYKQLKMRRQSLTCKKALSKDARSSSCPDLIKTVIPEDIKESGCYTFSYMTAPFLIFCLSNCILYFWYDVPYVYTIEFAEKTLKVPSQESSLIISVIGILNTFGELFVGWIGDKEWMSSSLLYAACMLCCAIATAIMPLVTEYTHLLGLSAVYGFCISANYSLTSPILVELVSIERFSAAYGFLLASQGVANLIGPPFAGWLYDYTEEWHLTFGLAGLFIGISGLLLLILPSIKRIVKSCSRTDPEQPADITNKTEWKGSMDVQKMEFQFKKNYFQETTKQARKYLLKCNKKFRKII